MTANRLFDIVLDTTQSTMTVRRTFDAGRQLVWDCHTKSNLLDQWFSPKPLTAKTKHMDFSVGGHWHYALIMPDGQHFWGRMDYRAISPIDFYTLLDGFCDETGSLIPNLPRASWTVTFSNASGRTLVQTLVTYASQEDLEKVIAMGVKDGMTSTMDRLDELLVTLAA